MPDTQYLLKKNLLETWKEEKGELSGKLIEEKCHFAYTFPETFMVHSSKI